MGSAQLPHWRGITHSFSIRVTDEGTTKTVSMQPMPVAYAHLRGNRALFPPGFYWGSFIPQQQLAASAAKHKEDRWEDVWLRKLSRAWSVFLELFSLCIRRLKEKRSSRPVLHALSALIPQLHSQASSCSVWCGFERPPAKKDSKPLCLISWACIQTTNSKFRHYHSACFIFMLLKDKMSVVLSWKYKALPLVLKVGHCAWVL